MFHLVQVLFGGGADSLRAINHKRAREILMAVIYL